MVNEVILIYDKLLFMMRRLIALIAPSERESLNA